MIEKIAMWGGIAGVGISLIAIIVLFLTKKSINHILNKDKILFDESFHMKKETISIALRLVDMIADQGNAVKLTQEFSQKAKQCYNELLCVLSDVKVADEFYNIAIDDTPWNLARIAHFKLLCRKDIGLKTKNAKTIKRVLEQQKLAQRQTAVAVPRDTRKQEPQEVSPIVEHSIEEPVTTQEPVQTVRPMAASQPVRPTRPVSPMQASQPVRPTNGQMPVRPGMQAVRPAPATQQPNQGQAPLIRRVGRPRKD